MRKGIRSSKPLKKRDRGQIRIIGGSMRGRKIDFIDGEGLRPTLDRTRETLYNWLAPHINGAVCLDLFAGSGALGIEAISRGAKSVAFVDASKQVGESLAQNISVLNISNAQIVNQSAKMFLAENEQKFDIVFLDPPFGKGMLEMVLPLVKRHLRKDALVYVEQENENSTFEYGEDWKLLKSKKTGRFFYQLIGIAGSKSQLANKK